MEGTNAVGEKKARVTSAVAGKDQERRAEAHGTQMYTKLV